MWRLKEISILVLHHWFGGMKICTELRKEMNVLGRGGEGASKTQGKRGGGGKHQGREHDAIANKFCRSQAPALISEPSKWNSFLKYIAKTMFSTSIWTTQKMTELLVKHWCSTFEGCSYYKTLMNGWQ